MDVFYELDDACIPVVATLSGLARHTRKWQTRSGTRWQMSLVFDEQQDTRVEAVEHTATEAMVIGKNSKAGRLPRS